MDSTTDISTRNQCAVVIRYVEEDKAGERLLRLGYMSYSRYNLKFPQFTREIFRRSRSLTGHVHWRLIRRDSEYERCLQWLTSSR